MKQNKNSNYLRLSEITYAYRGGRLACDNVNLELQPGVTVLLGPNGAGKTTLMNIMSLELKPQKGTLSFAGEIIHTAADKYKAQRNLGYLTQKFSIFPHFTVWETLYYAAYIKTETPPDNATIQNLLESLNLTEHSAKKIKELSGGMKQRVGIASAFITSPAYVILDEPTVGLDPDERIRFRKLIKQYSANGSTILISTHQTDDIEVYADNVILLNQGLITWKGTSSEFLAHGKNIENGVTKAESAYRQLAE